MDKTKSSKLFKLKKWLSLSETAHHLTGICEEQVTESDVLRLALDGHLMLSVYIVSNTWGRFGYLYSEELESYSSPVISGGWDIIHSSEDRIDFIKLDDNTKLINGIYDLPAIFQNRQGIGQKYSELLASLPLNLDGIGGIVVIVNGNTICQLQDRIASDDSTETPVFSPALELPEDSVIVVRTESLRRFEQFLSENEAGDVSNETDSKPNGHKERHAKNREQVLGAAFAVLAMWPNECRDSKRGVVSSKVADLVAAKANLFWPNTEPPLSVDSIADHLRDWLRKASGRK